MTLSRHSCCSNTNIFSCPIFIKKHKTYFIPRRCRTILKEKPILHLLFYHQYYCRWLLKSKWQGYWKYSEHNNRKVVGEWVGVCGFKQICRYLTSSNAHFASIVKHCVNYLGLENIKGCLFDMRYSRMAFFFFFFFSFLKQREVMYM